MKYKRYFIIIFQLIAICSNYLFCQNLVHCDIELFNNKLNNEYLGYNYELLVDNNDSVSWYFAYISKNCELVEVRNDSSLFLFEYKPRNNYYFESSKFNDTLIINLNYYHVKALTFAGGLIDKMNYIELKSNCRIQINVVLKKYYRNSSKRFILIGFYLYNSINTIEKINTMNAFNEKWLIEKNLCKEYYKSFYLENENIIKASKFNGNVYTNHGFWTFDSFK
jgi:hypothetical protein